MRIASFTSLSSRSSSWPGTPSPLLPQGIVIGTIVKRPMSSVYPLQGERNAMRTIILMVVAVASLATAGTATAATDPRQCGTETPGGQARHAYWCARNAAVAAVRTRMAARQHQDRWFYPTFCNERGSLLRWACVTTGGGQFWHATVAFEKTTSGWRAIVRVT